MKQVDPTANVVCFAAEPQTTQGEARSIQQLASAHHWKRIIVVMPIPQASRARLRIGRCYSGQVLEVGVEPQGFWDWVRGIVYEWGAMCQGAGVANHLLNPKRRNGNRPATGHA